MITDNIVVSQHFSWTDLENPHPSDFEFIESEFNLSPLLVNDCLRPEQLPKYEKTDNGFFFLIRPYDAASHAKEISIQKLTNKLAVFITGNTVVSIHNDVLFPLRMLTDLRKTEGFPHEPKMLMHQLFLITVMSYEEGISRLQHSYEKFEEEVLSSETAGGFNKTRVYEFRRRLYILKGLLQLTQQTLRHSREFWHEQRSWQQDIQENIDQIHFKIDNLSHNFDQLFALQISINEQRNNDVMKVLTIFASIMLPLTFISSFYGMNFEHLPGLKTTEGFVATLLTMISLTFLTVWVFYKKKWFRPSM